MGHDLYGHNPTMKACILHKSFCCTIFLGTAAVSSLSVTPYKQFYAVGDIIVCSKPDADQPRYEWMNLGNNAVTVGPVLNTSGLVVGTQYSYRCIATGISDGSSTSTNIIFTVQEGIEHRTNNL